MRSRRSIALSLIVLGLVAGHVHAQMSSDGLRKAFIRCSANFGLVAYLSPDQKRKEAYTSSSLLFLVWAAESIPNATKEQSNDIVTREVGVQMSALGEELRRVKDQPSLFSEFRERLVGESGRCESVFEVEVTKRASKEQGPQGAQ